MVENVGKYLPSFKPQATTKEKLTTWLRNLSPEAQTAVLLAVKEQKQERLMLTLVLKNHPN